MQLVRHNSVVSMLRELISRNFGRKKITVRKNENSTCKNVTFTKLLTIMCESQQKISFRQINYYLVSKTLFSRNICQKFRNFHTVLLPPHSSVNCDEIFRQINFLVISLVKTLVSRNFCQKM